MFGEDDSSAPSPAVVVSGLGHLSVPITPQQSSQLQVLGSPDAGCLGDGDSEPCVAWQLDPSQFQCSNPGYATYLVHPFAFEHTLLSCCMLGHTLSTVA